MLLIIEDNKYNVEFMLQALKEHKLEDRAKVFQDGKKALDYLFANGEFSSRDSSQQPKVIVLDFRLPKMDGLEILQRVRANDLTRMTPVVVFSSSTEDRHRVESYRLGANSYIAKPVFCEDFMKTFAEIGSYWALRNIPP
jgi:two-component system, response regulator